MKNNDSKSNDFENSIIQNGFNPIKKNKKIKNTSVKKRETGIPKQVANRMARRIAITTGIPTISGMGVFIGSYFIITEGIAEIAPVITLVTSGFCFFLGLVGLSYGILSASWDTNNGSLLGLENIRPNINRMKEAFKTKET
tara:strand:+ start:198 stop:620 length:423 start_codon:yes stop_codon:yes gene_type:complete